MTSSTVHTQSNSQDAEIWQNLKKAIASSSGFLNWRQARGELNESLDVQVRLYLEETLATLAY